MTKIGCGGERVVVISEGLWKRRFSNRRRAWHRRCRSTASPTPSIGVAPSGFSEVWRLDVWLPLGRPADPSNRGSNFLLSFGRLRDGMTLDGGAHAASRISRRRCRATTRSTSTRFTARPLHEVITENATRGLWMLLGATSLLLLIACTNVANLLLARAVVRERDLAIRARLAPAAGGCSAR